MPAFLYRTQTLLELKQPLFESTGFHQFYWLAKMKFEVLSCLFYLNDIKTLSCEREIFANDKLKGLENDVRRIKVSPPMLEY